MDKSLLLTAGLVILGMLCQAWLLADMTFARKDLLKFGSCIGACLFIFLPWKHEHDYRVILHLFMILPMFTMFFSLFFRDRLLPVISEQALLIWNILLVYALTLQFGFHNQWLLFAVIPSIATVALGFIPYPLHFGFKVIFYVWFLVMIVALGLLQFRFGDFAFFFTSVPSSVTPNISAFMSGAAFLSFGINAFYLFRLIPIPSKHQSVESRMKEWHEDVHLMASRFSDDQLRCRSTVFILLLGALLTANVRWQFVSGWLLINMCILLLPHAFFVLSMHTHKVISLEELPQKKS